MSFLERVQSALAELTASHSSCSTDSPFSASHSSLRIRMGRLMWSEYLEMICLSFQRLRYSVASSRRCRITLVPRCARVMVSVSKSPVPPLIQRTPSSAFRPARRDSTVILSATMKPE